jgi:EmrB/QacA subfamily drug resistance transporter
VDKKWWTLLAVCLGTFMLLLDITIVNVALPAIQQQLHASFSDLQWVVDAYALSLASLLLTAGSLADLYGRRVLFAAGLTLFTAGSALCGAAVDPMMLIVSRAAQGVGGAVMFATSLALLASAFQGRERGLAFAVWGAITGIAVAVGPVLGGVLTTGLSWRWIFFVNIPIGAFAVAVTVTGVIESREPNAHRPDWAGFATFTASLVALVYALIRAQQTAWTDTGVLVCFAASAAGVAAFLLVEHRGTQPMFDLSLFRKPAFVGASVAAFSLSATLFALLLYIVIYLQDDLGYSALGTGLRLLVMSAGILATSTLAGRASARVPVRWLIGPGLILAGAGLLVMTGLGAASSWTHLVPGFLLGGLGAGIVNPPLASAAVGVVEPRRAGMASGINSTFRQVGIATGIAALGTIFSDRLDHRLSAGLSHIPALTGHGHQIDVAITNGAAGRVFAAVPPAVRGQLVHVVRASFADGLNLILVIGGVAALVGAVASAALIRQRDFAQGSASHERAAEVAAAPG